MLKQFKVIILILLAGCANCTMAQNGTESHPNLVFISPLRIIDPINPGIQVGYQRSYDNRWASVFEVSRMMSTMPHGFYYSDYKGWRYQVEQKYFLLHSSNPKIRKYVAVDLAYMNVNFSDDEQFAMDTTRDAPVYWDNVHIHKTRLAGNAKYGLQIAVKRFLFDFAGGVGLVYRKVTYSGQSNPKAYYRYAGPDMTFEMEGSEPGDELLQNVTVDVRIAYSF